MADRTPSAVSGRARRAPGAPARLLPGRNSATSARDHGRHRPAGYPHATTAGTDRRATPTGPRPAPTGGLPPRDHGRHRPAGYPHGTTAGTDRRATPTRPRPAPTGGLPPRDHGRHRPAVYTRACPTPQRARTPGNSPSASTTASGTTS